MLRCQTCKGLYLRSAQAGMVLGKLSAVRNDLPEKQFFRLRFLFSRYLQVMQPNPFPQIADARVLLCDDSMVTRKLMAAILARQGFTVTEMESGEETLKCARQADPDVILLDVVLGEMDGFETCRRLKEDPDLAAVPIVFLTARTEMKWFMEGFAAGGADYITKPFNPIEVIARIETHAKVRRLMRAREKYIDALQEANDSKTRLIGVASHDLRGPLGSVGELTRLMLQGEFGELSEDHASAIRTVHVAAESMFDLVENMLDLAMIETNRFELDYDEYELEDIVQNAIELQRIPGNQKSVGLEYSGFGCDSRVECDKRQIRRVIDNLLSNAIKYSPSGTTTRLSLYRSGNHAVIRVEDEGPGIPENELTNLFEEFQTTSVKPTNGETSTGLGLSICKKIVHAHGGQICVENRPNGGCCFQFEIPLRRQGPVVKSFFSTSANAASVPRGVAPNANEKKANGDTGHIENFSPAHPDPILHLAAYLHKSRNSQPLLRKKTDAPDA